MRRHETDRPASHALYDVGVELHIVDTNPDYYLPLQHLLCESLNVRIHRFDSGEQYVEYLNAHTFLHRRIYMALVAYQFDSPDCNVMNGLEILDSISRLAPTVIPIMLAKDNELEFSTSAISSGAYAVIPRSSIMAMQIMGVILQKTSQQRIAIRKRQLRIAIYAFAVGLFLLLLDVLLTALLA